jgi:regulatory protein
MARKSLPPPLTAQRLRDLALHYTGRYATTEAKLRSYLVRKIRERGEADGAQLDPAQVAADCAALGYVNDSLYAEAKAAGLGRKGWGQSRIKMSLKAAGISDDIAAPLLDTSQDEALLRALTFAKRKRIGPYGVAGDDRKVAARWWGAMARGGHPPDIIRQIMQMRDGSAAETLFDTSQI